MEFDLNKSLEVLQRTPDVLSNLLSGLSDEWVFRNEGGETWSAFEVVRHLTYADQTNWMMKVNLILSDGMNKVFPVFDRFGFKENQAKNMEEALDEFRKARSYYLNELKSKKLTAGQLELTGIHPAFGKVKLSELLSTWTVHDLTHLAQISRVMAKQYREAVGPWAEYLSILK